MAKILVTGGSGFIGAHLCEDLLRKGHSVICLDDLSTGQICNLSKCLEHPAFTFIKHDVTSAIYLEVDEIYNLACPASPVHYQKNPTQTTKTCVLGALNMLELARKTGARFLQASTSEVYGDPLEHPQRETYWGNVNPIGPRACYDEGKRCAETLCFDYMRDFGVDVRVVRIFNTYGPKMRADDGRVVSNFITSALRGEPLTIYGDGKQTRSFCYVDDLISALTRYMALPLRKPGPLNIGNPQECTILSLAEMICALTGRQSSILHYPLPKDDPTKRRPDICAAKELLGWEPRIDLMSGLSKTIEALKQDIDPSGSEPCVFKESA